MSKSDPDLLISVYRNSAIGMRMSTLTSMPIIPTSIFHFRLVRFIDLCPVSDCTADAVDYMCQRQFWLKCLLVAEAILGEPERPLLGEACEKTKSGA